MNVLDDLRSLYRHNTWANRRVFSLCGVLEPGTIDARAPGTIGTVRETLAHLARVEEAFLCMIEDRSLDTIEPREAFQNRDAGALVERLEEIGDAFAAWLRRAGDQDLARVLPITWFDFPITAREGLYQVLSHSAQHRSQVLSVLGARGIEVPDLDYLLMLEEERKAPQK
jgi:uncharacterized damage-inducible protein DinB